MTKSTAHSLPSFSAARPASQEQDNAPAKKWTIEVHKTSAAKPSQRLKERAEVVRKALNCGY